MRSVKDEEILTQEERQEFLNDVFFRFCPNCGSPIIQKRRGRRKIYCSDKCRWDWKHKHPNISNWKNTRTVVCPVCGKAFLATHEYKRKRKYCSRACANRGRSREAKERKQHGKCKRREE